MGFFSSVTKAVGKVVGGISEVGLKYEPLLQKGIKAASELDPTQQLFKQTLGRMGVMNVGGKPVTPATWVMKESTERAPRSKFGQAALPIAGGIVAGAFTSGYGAPAGAAAGKYIAMRKAGAPKEESEKAAGVTGVTSAIGTVGGMYGGAVGAAGAAYAAAKAQGMSDSDAAKMAAISAASSIGGYYGGRGGGLMTGSRLGANVGSRVGSMAAKYAAGTALKPGVSTPPSTFAATTSVPSSTVLPAFSQYYKPTTTLINPSALQMANPIQRHAAQMRQAGLMR